MHSSRMDLNERDREVVQPTLLSLVTLSVALEEVVQPTLLLQSLWLLMVTESVALDEEAVINTEVHHTHGGTCEISSKSTSPPERIRCAMNVVQVVPERTNVDTITSEGLGSKRRPRRWATSEKEPCPGHHGNSDRRAVGASRASSSDAAAQGAKGMPRPRNAPGTGIGAERGTGRGEVGCIERRSLSCSTWRACCVAGCGGAEGGGLLLPTGDADNRGEGMVAVAVASWLSMGRAVVDISIAALRCLGFQ